MIGKAVSQAWTVDPDRTIIDAAWRLVQHPDERHAADAT